MLKKLTTIITTCDSWQVTDECLGYIVRNSTPEVNHIVLLDNGSYTKCPDGLCSYPNVTNIRSDINNGSNAVFHEMLPWTTSELLAFLHNDVPIVESGWDKRVIEAFDNDPLLGCVGFIGSNEVDRAGGRGLGTVSNFMGLEYITGGAAAAEVHGKRYAGLKPAATVDFCSMIFRREVLEKLSKPEVAHHFYDRIWCLETIENGYHVATLGIACDHFGGGIGMCRVPGEQVGCRNREDCYMRWADAEGIPYEKGQDLNLLVYNIAEKIYLNKWKLEKKLIPFKVRDDYSLERRH